MARRATQQSHPLRNEVLLLLQVAMLVFTWTVVIGILNGTDLVDFERKTLLSHVHMGTLGWITMCVFAASFWLFGATASAGQVTAGRYLAYLAVVALPIFGITFAFTYGDARPTVGTFALAAIVGVFVWVLLQARNVEMSTTHLGFLAAVATSVAGGTLGVLLATRIATGKEVISATAEDAHPATMVVGFLIPVGMALAEWALGWPVLRKATRLGQAQIGLPFLGGLVLLVGLLLEIDPLAPIAALLELVGVGIFVYRLWPQARKVDWLANTPARFAVLSAVATIVNIAFLNYLVARYEGDFDLVPDSNLLALDHIMFVGVLTNAIFGLLVGATEKDKRWDQAIPVVFFGMNGGLIAFAISLLAEWTWVMRIATPVMGASILLGLLVFTLRFRTGTATEAAPIAVQGAPAGSR